MKEYFKGKRKRKRVDSKEGAAEGRSEMASSNSWGIMRYSRLKVNSRLDGTYASIFEAEKQSNQEVTLKKSATCNYNY
jgi:hypothetical protein